MLTGISQHLRGERDDSHEPFLPQLSGNGTEDAGPSWLPLLVDQHNGVVVELDVRPVGPPLLLRGPHHHGLDPVALLHRGAGERVLDAADDDVADTGVAPAGTAEDTDAEHLPGTGVVGDA